ncbi:FMN-binding negative transcriptional regulator [Pusillimonas sp. SM2304]|uniref:FMN-binding negative transcriptional regulator n=1 Tax=Pusillimonas sp. SM2304 TaxID=3073241 RepID=UPI002875F698|nr:FMN-binding negative transcriptional regulator [Pusillimonas sp. SM2304]MDS1140200.1 FMN-binding negative transcriptional regulator [Pusillimonas sp. SM2304]
MYTPKPYQNHDQAELHACMRQWSFATLITHGPKGSQATHLPFLVDAESGPHGTLVTHIARANPQLADLLAGSPALVIFQGPHAFISPSWYENQQTFPTWNYAAIHARGTPVCIEEAESVRRILDRTVQVYDTPLGGSWRFDAMQEELILPRLKAIVAIRIPLDALEGKFKFNQDKSPADRLGVITALEKSNDAGNHAVATLMRRREPQPAASSNPAASKAPSLHQHYSAYKNAAPAPRYPANPGTNAK